MPDVNIKKLVDLYKLARLNDDKYILSHAEAAIEAAKDIDAAVHRLAVAEAIAQEALRPDIKGD